MLIFINGEPRQFISPMTVQDLLHHSGYAERPVAIEINGDVVPKSRHAVFDLNEGDRVEIIHAIGGG